MITNGFKPVRKPLDLEVKRATIDNVVASSAYTIGIGSAIAPGATGHNSYVGLAVTSGYVLGVVTALVFQGKVTEVTSIVGTNSASSGNNLTANVYNDNETTGYWQVDYIPTFIPISYSATLHQAAGTTTNSQGLGWFAIYTTAGAGTLDETSIALFSGTINAFWSYGTSTATGTAIPNGHWSKTL